MFTKYNPAANRINKIAKAPAEAAAPVGGAQTADASNGISNEIILGALAILFIQLYKLKYYLNHRLITEGKRSLLLHHTHCKFC